MSAVIPDAAPTAAAAEFYQCGGLSMFFAMNATLFDRPDDAKTSKAMIVRMRDAQPTLEGQVTALKAANILEYHFFWLRNPVVTSISSIVTSGTLFFT